MTQNSIIVLLSGEIASGKTTLTKLFEKEFDFKSLKTRDALLSISKGKSSKESDRVKLQKLGEKLDKETKGEWLVRSFQNQILNETRIVIDSVRILDQIHAFRHSYGYQNVYHIHLRAEPNVLETRYFERDAVKNSNSLRDINEYSRIKSDPTEKNVKSLEEEADLVIDTDNVSAHDNLIRAASFLRILPSVFTKNVDVVIGGQFGSEGKGQIVGYMSPNYDCLVRVGGPNAGHKVFNSPEADTFHILPSGTRRAQDAKIFIGPGAVISKDVILNEVLKFEVEPGRLIIDENATIISTEDKKLEEQNIIGSTKQGVGGATANNLLNRLKQKDGHKAKYCNELTQLIGNVHQEFEGLFSNNKKILLEGTQGTFLSLHHGFYPFVTSRDTTASGCLAEAGISPLRVRKIVMVTRSYPIRVESPKNGTSGPFTRSEYVDFLASGNTSFDSEIDFELIKKRAGHPEDLDQLEITTTTKKKRRVGEFSWPLFREAVELNSPTDIALTFADYLDYNNRLSRRYDRLSDDTKRFIEELERCSGTNVSLIATGFEYRAIIDRRNWT